MSNIYQSDIFRILNQDHQKYLQPYSLQCDNKRIDGITAECNNLARKITSICNLYTRNIDQDDCKGAVKIIKEFLTACRNRRLFKEVKNRLIELRHKHPVVVLKQVNYTHSQIFDINHFQLVFRLDGNEFPPVIVYSICPKIDLNIVNLRTNILYLSEDYYIYNKWYKYKAYKCHICKTTRKSKGYRKENKKRKTANRINWIERMYM
ncbi:uncharacterized protein LOC130900311 [Diorhabda carinulata]|uniref:uncharacterized protein LOC130900311 n=1 Tax=Diorhabda carinulata TaxID=1163345 RepID=UPI0025A13567|nr:uncharacterized protein LOC130900311 [Diorhabda carinulata]